MITMPYRHIIIILAAVLAVIQMGCVKTGKHIEPPKISLVNIKVQSIKLFETILQIELRVMNPNDIHLEIKGLDCNLALNGKKFASGVSDTRTKIPPFRSAIVPMTIYSSVFDAFKGLTTSRRTQDLHYKVEGRVHLTKGLLLPAIIPFSSEGTFSFEEWNTID